MPLIHQLIVIQILKQHLNKTMQDPNTQQRFPATDEHEFIDSEIDHADIVFEENDKLEQKLNNHFEQSNNNHWEDRVCNE